MAYTERQRAIAVEIAKRSGGVLDNDTLHAIRVATKLPNLTGQTIRNWLKGHSQGAEPPTSKPLSKTKIAAKKARDEAPGDQDEVSEIEAKFEQALDIKLEEAAHRFVSAAMRAGKINDAGTRELMTSAGIAIDKMRLLRNLPTTIISILPDLVTELEKGGADASTIFQNMLERARAANARR